MISKKSQQYGWIIVFCSFLMLWVTNGLTLSGLTVFDKPILDEMSWKVGGLKFRDFITLMGTGLLAPFVGGIADKIGVRIPMMISIVTLSAGYFLYSTIESLTMVYLIHFLFAITLASGGLVINVMLVSRWFLENRGAALGLALVGTSMGNALFPQINTYLLSMYGWRDSFQIVALVPLLMIPIIFFVIQEKPSDSTDDNSSTEQSKKDIPGMEYFEAIRTTNFWVITLIAMSTFYSILAFSAHLVLYMIGQGFTKEMAAGGVGVLFMLGIIGKSAFGFLADRVDKKTVFTFNLGLMFIGTLCIVWAKQILFWPAIIMVGFGWGGLYTLLQLLSANIFGNKALGKILGTVTILDAFGGGMGIWLTGVLYDSTGSYATSFNIIAALVGLSFVLSFFVNEKKGYQYA